MQSKKFVSKHTKVFLVVNLEVGQRWCRPFLPPYSVWLMGDQWSTSHRSLPSDPFAKRGNCQPLSRAGGSGQGLQSLFPRTGQGGWLHRQIHWMCHLTFLGWLRAGSGVFPFQLPPAASHIPTACLTAGVAPSCLPDGAGDCHRCQPVGSSQPRLLWKEKLLCQFPALTWCCTTDAPPLLGRKDSEAKETRHTWVMRVTGRAFSIFKASSCSTWDLLSPHAWAPDLRRLLEGVPAWQVWALWLPHTLWMVTAWNLGRLL